MRHGVLEPLAEVEHDRGLCPMSLECLGGGDQRALIARLRAVIEGKDAENVMLRAELAAQLERYRRLELRVAELERRLGSDSTNSGIPPSKDPIGARERRRAGRKRERQSSERDRREDRRRGGQPGHPGAGLQRDPDPDGRDEVPPPEECSRCGAGLAGAERAGTWWSQVWDVKITRFVTEYLPPLLACPCCGKVNAARGPGQSHPGSVSYGPGINTAAVLLASYGNVPSERAANLIGMLTGMPVSAGFVDLASERLSARLQDAGFDDAMQAALGKEPVLAADETPVNLLDPRAGLAEADAGAPHVLVVRTPNRGLTWLRALGSRAGRRNHRDLVVLHWLPDQRRVLRLPAAPAAARRGAAVLPARHPALPRGHQAGARQPAVVGRRRHRCPARSPPGRAGSPGQGRSGAGRGASGEATRAL